MKNLLFAIVKFIAQFINTKIIPLCIFIHEYSHYWAAKLLGMEVEKLVLYEKIGDEMCRGYVKVKDEYTETGKHSNSYIIKFALVAIAPIIPFFILIGSMLLCVSLCITFQYNFVLYATFKAIFFACSILIFFGVRVGLSDWKIVFGVIGYYLGIVDLYGDENIEKT